MGNSKWATVVLEERQAKLCDRKRVGQLKAIGIAIAAFKTATEAVGPAWALVEQVAGA